MFFAPEAINDTMLYALSIAYCWALFASPAQASIGCLLLNIKVTNCQGQQIGFWHVFGRFCLFSLVQCIAEWTLGIDLRAMSISYIVFVWALTIGMMIPIFFTKERTSIDDMIWRTRFICDYNKLSALAPGVTAPSLWHRLFAYMIDSAFIPAFIFLMYRLPPSLVFFVFFPLLFWPILNQLILPLSPLRATIGMWLVGLKWVKLDTGLSPTWRNIMGRASLFAVLFVPIFLALVVYSPELPNILVLIQEENSELLAQNRVFTILAGALSWGFYCRILYGLPLIGNRGIRSLTDKLSGLQMARKQK
jgi:uncharacterized RDD family membrane protein YckC